MTWTDLVRALRVCWVQIVSGALLLRRCPALDGAEPIHLPYIVAYRDHKKGTCTGNGALFETDTLKVYGNGSHSHPKHDFRIEPHFRYFLGGLIFPFWRCMGKCMGNRWPLSLVMVLGHPHKNPQNPRNLRVDPISYRSL